MKRALVIGTLAFATASFVPSAPVAAADMMPKVDCSKADTMMSAPMKMPAMTGDMDKDYMAMAMASTAMTEKLNHIEAMCGKDPKMKSMAAKQEADAEQRMTMFRNQGMSQ